MRTRLGFMWTARRACALLASSALVAGIVVALPAETVAAAPATSASSAGKPAVPSGMKAKALAHDPASDLAPRQVPVLPTPGQRHVVRGGDQPGDVVTLGDAQPVPAAAGLLAAPGVASAQVDILDVASAAKVNAQGLAFRIARSDGIASSDQTSVVIDYSKFRELYGGNWAGRLRIFRYPACALTTPTVPGCLTGEPLPVVNNDATTGHLTVDLSVDADPAVAAADAPSGPAQPGATTSSSVQTASVARLQGSALSSSPSAAPLIAPTPAPSATVPASDTSGSIMVLAASGGGSWADYTSTSLSPSSTWQVGPATGEFSWSHDIPAPAAPAGPTPDMALTYSSGSVDGMTLSANAQASTVGTGWELSPPFIERSFASCHNYLSTHPAWGDLCYPGLEVASLVVNGSSSPLVFVGSGEWRVTNKPGWRVQRVIDTLVNNGDYNDVYWKITDPNGTTWWYGTGHQDGPGTGTATNSALRVPVYGGSRCGTGGWCWLAYRWYLDRVIDTNGNQSTYFYSKELNYYNSIGDSAPHLEYDRASHLKQIDYGSRAGSASAHTNRLTFDYEPRCVNQVGWTPTNWNVCSTAAVPTDQPDVPTDQLCVAASCSSSQTSPTFFTSLLLRQIGSFVAHGTTQPQWLERFYYQFPGPGDGTGSSLWLNGVQHIGVQPGYTWPATFTAASYSTTGQTLTPTVTFSSTGQDGSSGLYPNRRDYNTALGVPPMNHFRLRTIQNELGGRVHVTYATDTACDATPPSWDSQTSRCYPMWWSPPAPISPGFGVFYKYTVSSVVESDAWASAPDVTTTYTYGGTPAWHYEDIPSVIAPKDAAFADKLTWSDWRGYATVTVARGKARTWYWVYRGMEGDRRAAGGCNAYSAPQVNGGFDWPYDQGLVAQVKYLTSAGVSRQVISYSYLGVVQNGTIADVNYCTSLDHVAYLMAPTRVASVTGEGLTLNSTIDRSYDTDGRLVTERTNNDVTGTAVPAYPASQVYNTCRTIEYATTAATTPPVLLDVPARVKVYQQTAAGQACNLTAPAGAKSGQTDTYYDGNATLTGLTLTKGNVTQTDTYASASAKVTTKATYDGSLGRVATTTDANNHVTKYDYSPLTGYPDSLTVTNALNQATVTSFDSRFNVASSVTDAGGHVTSLRYDDLGRLACVWAPQNVSAVTAYPTCAGTAAPANRVLAYRNTGSSIPSVVTMTRLDDAATPSMATRYDYLTGFGKPRETQTPNPTNTAQTLVSDTTYNTDGLVASQSLPTWSTAAPGAAFINPDPVASSLDETRTTYDEFGRVTTAGIFRAGSQVLGSDNKKKLTTTTYTPVGSKTTPDAGGGSVSYVDAGGRPLSAITLSRTSAYLDSQYAYAYDSAGVLTTTRSTPPTSGSGGTRISSNAVSDWLGRTTSARAADGGTSTFSYYNGGQLQASTIPTSPVTNLFYTYDSIDRPANVYNGTSSAAPLLRSWSYDTGAGNAGRLVGDSSVDTLSRTWSRSYGYDSAGRQSSITLTPPAALGFAASYTTNYTLDEADRPTSVGYPSTAGAANAETVTTQYDVLSNPLVTTGQIGATTTNYVTGTQFNTDGTLKNRTYSPTSGSAWVRAFGYTNGDRRVATATMTLGATTAQSDSYAWDSVGDLASIADKTGSSQTACYAYDDYQRLIRAVTVAGTTGTECTTLPNGAGTGGVPWSYTYALDSAGGLTSAKDEQSAITTAYTYPTSGSTPHLPSSITVTGSAAQTVTPDGAGRVTAIGATTLTWDPFGMNATASSGGVTTTSAYTADGLRVARTDSTGSTTLYLPDQEITKTGSTLSYTRYIHHGGTTVAVRTSNTTVSINASDMQGSAAITINAANAITRRYATPYGAQITSTGGTLPGQRRFLGHVQDPTGLVDAAARSYQPTLGFFLAPDPIDVLSAPQASSAYAYGSSNPTSFSDPSGLMTQSLGGGGDPVEPAQSETLANGSNAVQGAGHVAVFDGSGSDSDFYVLPPGSDLDDARGMDAIVPWYRDQWHLGDQSLTTEDWNRIFQSYADASGSQQQKAYAAGPVKSAQQAEWGMAMVPAIAAMTGTTSADKGAKDPRHSSRALRKNMIAAGVTPEVGDEAHHIVANDPRAEPARAILKKYGIGINDAINGVFLPGNSSTPNPNNATVHRSMHTDAYYRWVNRYVATARGAGDLSERLSQIADYLQRGQSEP